MPGRSWRTLTCPAVANPVNCVFASDILTDKPSVPLRSTRVVIADPPEKELLPGKPGRRTSIGDDGRQSIGRFRCDRDRQEWFGCAAEFHTSSLSLRVAARIGSSWDSQSFARVAEQLAINPVVACQDRMLPGKSRT